MSSRHLQGQCNWDFWRSSSDWILRQERHFSKQYFRNILLTLQNPSMHIYFISHLLYADKQLLHTDSAIKPVNSYYISIRAAERKRCMFGLKKLLQIIFDVSVHKGSQLKHLALAMLRPIQTSKTIFFSIKHLAWVKFSWKCWSVSKPQIFQQHQKCCQVSSLV